MCGRLLGFETGGDRRIEGVGVFISPSSFLSSSSPGFLVEDGLARLFLFGVESGVSTS